MTAYYNEIDPFAAQWLRELIKAGHIAPGFVDERSIEDVKPDELLGYTQCHFFAGIGVWSYALRSAEWPDDRPVWTGSCPCQPFSAAGKGNGFADERHLWPHFQWLIEQCRPAVIFGEQVASKAVEPWIDLVQTDVEALGYAFGCVAFPAASVGAPHIRDRAYWVADSAQNGWGQQRATAKRSGGADWLADPLMQQRPDGQSRIRNEHDESGRYESAAAPAGLCGDLRPSPTNGFWRNADWLGCRDGKFRPVEPGTFPLVNGAPARVGRLRGYGNAIVAQQAEVFVKAVMEATA